jgi:hypothetical protein
VSINWDLILASVSIPGTLNTSMNLMEIPIILEWMNVEELK